MNMDLYWIAWWVVPLVMFIVGESYAFKTNRKTLSAFMWGLAKAWPPISFIAGALCGGLVVHFLWHWCPDVGVGVGFLTR